MRHNPFARWTDAELARDIASLIDRRDHVLAAYDEIVAAIAALRVEKRERDFEKVDKRLREAAPAK